MLKHHDGAHPWIRQENFTTKNSPTNVTSDLTTSSSYKSVILGMLWEESDNELNTTVNKECLNFSTVIKSTLYGQWSGSYDLWKLTVVAELSVMDIMKWWN
jgi:hypothetical protein